MANKEEIKWLWMMNYCRKLNIPPAQQWAWDKATKAWEETNAK